jgi:rhamnosyltransferase
VTLNAEKHLEKVLPQLLNSPLKPRVLVLDSTSTDNTAALAKAMGAETLVIPRHEFNHGLTRELGRRHLNTDIITMHTQDAYLKDEHTLEKLVEPLLNEKAHVSYARQLPHKDANFFESFPRSFNYPSKSHIRGLDDIPTYGVYTFFCSDSCAAYCNTSLKEIGGFSPVLLGEDTVAVAKILRKGGKIAYVAEAEVFHSHSHTLLEEFKRNFDTGIARAMYKELLACGCKDGERGRAFAKEMGKQLIKKAPQQIPYAILHLFAKWTGYKMGQRCQEAPIWLKKQLSSQPYFWK